MNESGGNSESPIIKADPKHKMIVVCVILGILGLGVFVLTAVPPFLESWLNTFVEELANKSREELLSDYKFFTSMVALSLVLPLALSAMAYVYQAYRVYDSQQYPYPGMMILRDTPLETGDQARRWGKRFVIVAGVLLVSGCILGWYLYDLLMRILLTLSSSPCGSPCV